MRCGNLAMKFDEKWDVQVLCSSHSESLIGWFASSGRGSQVSAENLRLERSLKATWGSKVQANDRDTHARTTTMRAVRGELTVQYT